MLKEQRWFLFGLCALAFNQRIVIASIGPFVSDIRADTGLSDTTIGFLSGIPVVCFAVCSFYAARLLRRFGHARGLVGALALLAIGTAVRGQGSIFLLFAGMVVAGAAIAAINVAIPGIVKSDFAGSAGWVTGTYAVVGSVGTAAAAGLTLPLRDALHLSWRQALAIWSVPAMLAAGLWLALAALRPGTGDAQAEVDVNRAIHRRSVVVVLGLYLGLQSVVYYCMLAWLPEVLRADGFSAGHLSAALLTVQVAAIPATFAVPALASRVAATPGLLVLVCGAAQLGGLTWVILSPQTAVLVWASLIGLGSAAFPLGFLLIVLNSSTADETNRLSSLSQTIAYTMAATGPVLLGYVRDLTGAWRASLGLLLLVTAVGTLAGIAADVRGHRNRRLMQDEDGAL